MARAPASRGGPFGAATDRSTIGTRQVTRPPQPPLRARTDADGDAAKPIYAVWEVTMRCDQPCQHCGSRAGAARPEELDTDACLEVVAALGRMGCREAVLIGGEAYLRPDLPVLIEALVAANIRVILQTGGRGLSDARLAPLVAAGLSQVGVSIDGPQDAHDELRGNRGSYAAALAAVDRARAAGVRVSANTQVNRLNFERLAPFARTLQAHGVQAWQVALTVPMGHAADRPQWLLPPHRILDVIDTLAQIQLEAAARAKPGERVFDVSASNTVGYFGPHEQVIRSRPGGLDAVWGGCKAGMNTIGIESDGTVKGCPSLPTGPYAGGNLRTMDLDEIWRDAPQISFNRQSRRAELWGRCASCYYADHCEGGCSWMAHTTLGRRGNNPFCYHRADALRRAGLRERLVPRRRAPNAPYDFGGFDVEEVPWDTPEAEDPVATVDDDGRRRLPIAKN